MRRVVENASVEQFRRVEFALRVMSQGDLEQRVHAGRRHGRSDRVFRGRDG